MKQRKLFAILTLVAFMMTLLPMAAFASTPGAYSAQASYISADKDEVNVDKDVEFTLVLRKGNGNVLAHNTVADAVYFKSSGDVGTLTFDKKYIDGATEDYELKLQDAAGKEGLAVNNLKVINGAVKFDLRSAVAGTITLSLYNGNPDEDGLLIGEKTITIKATSSSVEDVTLDVENGLRKAGQSNTFTAKVTASGSNPVADQTVDFYKRLDNGSWSRFASAKTNVLGEAEVKYTETKKGSYQYYAKAGSEDSRVSGNGVPVTVTAADPITIEAKADSKYVEVDEDVKLYFVLRDYYGNIHEHDAAKLADITRVSGDKDEFEHVSNAKFWDGDEKAYYDTVRFTEKGSFVVKSSIEGTGIEARVSITVGEFGDVKELKVSLPDDKKYLIAKDADTFGDRDNLDLKVEEIDENGIKKDISSDVGTKVKLSTSNASLVRFGENGVDKTVYGPNDDAKTGIATITATHVDTGITTTIEIPVVGTAAGFTHAAEFDGKTAVVTMQAIDANGNNTYFDETDSTEYTIFAPNVVTSALENFKEGTGKATFEATVEEYGSYDFTVVTENGFAKNFTLEFKQPTAEKPGANKVTLFIGQQVAVVDGDASVLDVAPFIKDGRTFVPVRFIAEALGAEVKYDAATQVVTATRGDDVVVMTIGSNVMTVNGEAQVTDVAPFIVDGRTVLPFRALAEAFGSEVAWDAATQSVVFEK